MSQGQTTTTIGTARTAVNDFIAAWNGLAELPWFVARPAVYRTGGVEQLTHT